MNRCVCVFGMVGWVYFFFLEGERKHFFVWNFNAKFVHFYGSPLVCDYLNICLMLVNAKLS